MKNAIFATTLLLTAMTVDAAGQEAGQQSGRDEIGYNSVREALEDLRKQPGATLTIQGQWNVISDPTDNARVLWSFTQPGHYAFPAVARREVLEENGAPYVDTTLLCEASAAACDQLFVDFQTLDKNLGGRMRNADPAN